MTKKELAEVVAKAYNEMDMSILESCLSEDFVYEMPSESFSLFRRLEEREGKKLKPFVYEYDKALYLHFQKMTFGVILKTSAEVSFSKCLNQIAVKLFWEGIYEGTLKIWKQGDRIVRMRQCYLPEENGMTETEEQ